jgi:RimJ/RimL family protein N-acetyltransferase
MKKQKNSINLRPAHPNDISELTQTCIRAFHADLQFMPLGSKPQGPPGYDDEIWNAAQIEQTIYYTIVFEGRIAGGIILYNTSKPEGPQIFNVGRIWIDASLQNSGIGQEAMRLMLVTHPEIKKWNLGTPSWAIRNHHFYEKVGFSKIFETDIDPVLGWSSYEYELEKV